MTVIRGQLVDIPNERIYPAAVFVDGGYISRIEPLSPSQLVGQEAARYILPGFVDAHVHIESSMLVPSEFARLAVVHGTVGTVSDPHEIANVCGIPGVEFMIENGGRVPFKFNFGAPSCVPATSFETAGAMLDAGSIRQLLARPNIRYLTEMMNFPGVLQADDDVMQKIKAAHDAGKPVDGHAPGLRGEAARKYIEAGISTDHECFTYEEALEKLKYGMKILIREGSAAKNFEALIPLLHEYPRDMMFCSDDKHPDSLTAGHINQLCQRAVAKGIPVFHVLRAACINPVEHYKLDIGLLNEGDPADFILVKDLEQFEVMQTYINGELVADAGTTRIQSIPVSVINQFNAKPIDASQLKIREHVYPKNGEGHTLVIEALDGQLITNKLSLPLAAKNGEWLADIAEDILKIVVVNRYHPAPIAGGFIKNFGLRRGAIASSVAHDSHNIVAVGANDEDIATAVNLVIEHRGGVSCVDGKNEQVLPLPIAGLMSAADGYEVASSYTSIDQMAKALGSKLSAPFMTLSFMALLVIPHLKLSDKGLFDGDDFRILV